MAEKAFDLAQNAAKTWLGSNWAFCRELLQILRLNRELDETSLYITWNKPFDSLAKQPVLKKDPDAPLGPYMTSPTDGYMHRCR
jgi:hypothetical protein